MTEEDAATLVDDLTSIVGFALTALQTYILALEITAATTFESKYQSQAPSSANTTFFMAIFLGATVSNQSASTVIGTLSETQPSKAQPAGTSELAPSPAIGSSPADEPSITANLSPPNSASAQVTSSTAVAASLPIGAPVTPYGQAFFYWNTKS